MFYDDFPDPPKKRGTLLAESLNYSITGRGLTKYKLYRRGHYETEECWVEVDVVAGGCIPVHPAGSTRK